MGGTKEGRHIAQRINYNLFYEVFFGINEMKLSRKNLSKPEEIMVKGRKK